MIVKMFSASRGESQSGHRGARAIFHTIFRSDPTLFKLWSTPVCVLSNGSPNKMNQVRQLDRLDMGF